jgi:hypothetical protein
MTDYEAAFWKLQNNWHESVKHYEKRIEKLEAALRSYVCNCTTEICDDCLTSTECGYRARKALEGKDD